VNWVLDADIRGFYDAMSHAWIIRFLEHRIADKRILRLVAKWLKVGITEDGRVRRSEVGAPQGAVISPILATSTCTTSTICGSRDGAALRRTAK
jgi:retron-type reverse transcriptase